MKNNKIYQSIWIVIMVLFTNACVEPIDIETLTFEDVLVIEARITNELKHQEIKLSRSFKFEDEDPVFESNADVKIIDDSNNIFQFRESSMGSYFSVVEFKAQPNIKYQLQIQTNSGKSYISKKVELTNSSSIDNVYASREIIDSENEGVSIFIDSNDPDGNSKYYSYEYEETYKIIAPYWSPVDMIVVDNKHLVKQPKTKEERTCYNSVDSNTIIQTETTNLTEDRVSKFEVRFIPRDNAIISYRYSILIRQYIQSFDAFSYFKTLNKLSGSGNIFSQNQPGFFSGNIFSTDNKEEKVIGFFEVNSVSSKRIFFNYYDLFPDEPLPPYFVDCKLGFPSTKMEAGEPSSLMDLLNAGTVKYYEENDNYPNPENENEGKYIVVSTPCGDCTQLGTNVKPDFWVD